MDLQRNTHKDKGQEEALSLHLREVAKGGAVAFAGRVGGIFMALGFYALVARTVGAASLGYFSMINTLYVVLAMISSLGLYSSVLKFGGDAFFRKDMKFIRGFLAMGLRVIPSVSLPLGLFFFLFADEVGGFFSKPEFSSHIKVFGAFLPLLALFYFLTEAFKAARKPGLVVLFQNILLYAVAALLLPLFKYGGKGHLSSTLSFVVSASLLLLPVVYSTIKTVGWGEKEKLRFTGEYRKTSLFLMFSGLFVFLLFQMDRLMIGYFRSAEEVGIYSASSRLAVFVAFGLAMINYIFPPLISSLFSQGNLRGIEEMGRRTARWASLFAFSTGLFFLTYPGLALGIFGGDFQRGKMALVFLVIFQILASSAGSTGYVLSMTRYQGAYFVITLLGVLANFVGNAILIPARGIEGAALASGVSLALTKGAQLVWIKKKLGIWVAARRPLGILFSILAGLLVEHLLKKANFWLGLAGYFPLVFLALLFNTDSRDRKVFLSLFGLFPH